jgi:hypothetical protein
VVINSIDMVYRHDLCPAAIDPTQGNSGTSGQCRHRVDPRRLDFPSGRQLLHAIDRVGATIEGGQTAVERSKEVGP